MEIWKPIHSRFGPEEFVSSFEVSNLGNVRSLDRYVLTSNGQKRFYKGSLLKKHFWDQKNWDGGYWYVKINKNRKSITPLVHILVAYSFLDIPNSSKNIIVCHGPNGFNDNSASNLSFGTQSDNMYDRKRDGTDHQLNKTHCIRGHILSGANLSAGHAKRGHRKCLACERAFNWVRYHDGTPEQFQELSDRCFETESTPRIVIKMGLFNGV